MQQEFLRPAPVTASASFPGQQAAGLRGGEPSAERQVGMFHVRPLVKPFDNGWFASSVSIRSGPAGTDRVLRLTRLFRCAKEAAAYAHAEALQWINAPRRQCVPA